MTEEDVVRLFTAAGNIGYRYQIALIGEDSLVPMKGAGEEADFRVSDTEHVIHELAHCALLAVDFDQSEPETLMTRLTEEQAKYHQHLQQINEIETFSVTLEVLRQLGVEPEFDAFMTALEDFQLHDFDVPFRFNVEAYVKEFHTTARGRVAVNKIVEIFKKEGA